MTATRKNATDRDRKINFRCFVNDLEKLSLKYGVAINSCGGIEISDFTAIEYDCDHTSGDLNYSASRRDGFMIGDQVEVDRFITTDPFKRAGQTGTVETIDDDVISVKFPDGKNGLYMDSVLNLQ